MTTTVRVEVEARVGLEKIERIFSHLLALSAIATMKCLEFTAMLQGGRI